jgi:hypothetical protein
MATAGIERGVEGSYCVRVGSEFDWGALSPASCDIDSNECGDGNP